MFQYKTIIMKKTLFGFGFIFLFSAAVAQNKQQDSLAILIIDRMTDVIGDLESCSFRVLLSKDVADSAGLVNIKQFADCKVYLSGNDKMLVDFENEKGHRRMWYNGEQLAYYFRDEHNYGVIPAPSTTIRMIDSVNAVYHIDFPAADFFYPAFTDDLLENNDVVKFLGRTRVNGQDCFHILASNKEMVTQIWVSSDEYSLPLKYVITYRNRDGFPQFEGSFSEWKVNPGLPSALFNFEPPPGSNKVTILSSTKNN